MKEKPSRERQFIAYTAYEKLADVYSEQIETKPHNAYLERPATLSLLPDVKEKCVLDVGCGPGIYSEWLVKHGAKVVAIDASPRMVQYAKKRLRKTVDVKLHDLRKPLIFLDSNTFDVVLAPLVMHYIENWVPVFREFKRILRNDGIFIFSVEHPFIDNYLKKSLTDYFAIELVKIWWKTWGVRVLMPSYRRPLEAMIRPLFETGFLIEQILETRPTAEYKEADPEGYEKISKRPSFICIKAIPK